MPTPAPAPDTRPPHALLPARRALLGAVIAFLLGLLAFLALWWDQRNSTDFYRTEPGLPSLGDGQVFEPLPAPMAASERENVMAAQEAEQAREDAVRREAAGARIEEETPAEAAPPPPPRDVAQAPSGPTSLPHPIQQPAPRYPRDAYRRGEQGTVLLRVHVAPNGDPRDIDLVSSSGSHSLDRAAIDAVRRWRFAPAMRGESPVEGAVQVPIEFALGR
jgi:protein TonB